MEYVVLVNSHDEEVGTMEKLEAHEKGILHRAFSIFLFNSAGEMLLQRRAAGKYHSPGLWTNSCCSHPLPDEPMAVATRRKLFQELGITPALEFAFKFTYRAQVGTLIEHETDHVFTGIFDGEPQLNPAEADDWKYLSVEAVLQELATQPEKYTEWFRIIMGNPEFIHKFHALHK